MFVIVIVFARRTKIFVIVIVFIRRTKIIRRY